MTSKFNIDNRELLQRISCGEAVVGIDFGNLIVRQLAAFRLAAMDSEPVFTLQVSQADYKGQKLGNHFGFITLDAARELDEGNYQLYRHAQPAPVVPEDVLDALQKVARIRLDLNDFDGDRRGIADCLCDAEEALIEVVNRRAAMLAASPQSPGSEPATVPGTWIPVSERMPEDDDFVYIWPRPDFGVELHVGQYCEFSPKGDGWYAQVHEQNYGIEWHPITVTHWMPLPAAPQEVRGE